MKIEDQVLEMIRQRNGFEKEDSSFDAEIEGMTPIAKLRAVVAWQLGDPGWADQIMSWATACGFEVKAETK